MSPYLHGEVFAFLSVYCPPCHPLNFLMETFAKLSDLAVDRTFVGSYFIVL